jgi:hypothetical protein
MHGAALFLRTSGFFTPKSDLRNLIKDLVETVENTAFLSYSALF